MQGQPVVMYRGPRDRSPLSMCVWVILNRANIKFKEIEGPVETEGSAQHYVDFHGQSESLWSEVPRLMIGNQKIWSSLSIAEYVAEFSPFLWPRSPRLRACARSIAAALQRHHSLRYLVPFSGHVAVDAQPSECVYKEIRKLEKTWKMTEPDCNFFKNGDGFLFGDFTIADGLGADLAVRLYRYKSYLDYSLASYVCRTWEMPEIQIWLNG